MRTFLMMKVSSPALMVPLPSRSAWRQPVPGTAGQPAALPSQFRMMAMILVTSPADTVPLPLQSPSQGRAIAASRLLQISSKARQAAAIRRLDRCGAPSLKPSPRCMVVAPVGRGHYWCPTEIVKFVLANHTAWLLTVPGRVK
jgi:hypothetical protein